MKEHRRQILDMLSSGQITSEEAERLLTALEKGPEALVETTPESRPRPKYIRVVVEPIEGSIKSAPRVNVRVPMMLLRAGVKLASLIPKAAEGQINQAMREKGLTIDLSELTPENLDEIIDHLNDLTVDVDEKDVKVRVFCE
jgi:hypothetical protein